MFTIKELFYIIPELVILCSSVFFMILYPITLYSRRKQPVPLYAINEYRLSLILIYLATLYILIQIPVTEPILLLEQQYLVTPATQFCKAFMLIAIIILLLIAPYQTQFLYWEEHMILTIFVILSGMFMISANDFLILWLSVEFQSFSFVIGIAFFRNGEAALRSGTIYFVTSAVMSSVMLLGIWLIYGITAEINFSKLYLLVKNPLILEEYPAVALGAILILSYFFFKLAYAPFHLWNLNVFTTVNLFIVYQIGIISKISAILPFYYIITLFLSNLAGWLWLAMPIAISSIIVGAFGAFYEDNLKRFLAYSSVNHVGWLLLPITLKDGNALQISFLYFILYIVLSISLFCLLFTTVPHSTEDTFVSIDSFAQIRSLGKPILISYLTILFSFVGVPPFLGFFSKTLIFFIFISHEFVIIPIILILLASISAAYYLRLIVIILLGQADVSDTPITISFVHRIIIYSLTLVNMFGFIILPGIFFTSSIFFI